MEKDKLCDVPKWGVTSSKMRNVKVEFWFSGKSIIKWKDNCMRKRYYNYDLDEWTIIKAEKEYREILLQTVNRNLSPLGVRMDLL